MEFGLREWLIIIGIIVIAGILFDGWRRMRGGKGTLKFKLDRRLAESLADDESGVLGPARVVRSTEPALGDLSHRTSPSAAHSAAAARQRDLEFDEPVPTLLNPLDEGDQRDEADEAPMEELLVINVVCRDPQGFKGPELLQSILESGLRFGEMDIFHRHESMTGHGEVLFSMANGVKPGTFDLDDIDLFTTRAVSFFLGLPGPRHSKQAFDVMIAAARKLAHELDGELKDDQRSVLTAQTIEHYRQRITDFERRHLTKQR
jgi:cell division protein ZipA